MPVLPPCACSVVFSVSTGMRTMRKSAAATLANALLSAVGRLRMKPLDWRSARMPTFAAVSPNLTNVFNLRQGLEKQ